MGNICSSNFNTEESDNICKCRHLDDFCGFSINTECNCINKICKKCGNQIHRKECLKYKINND